MGRGAGQRSPTWATLTVEAPHPAHTGSLASPGRHVSRLALRNVAVGPTSYVLRVARRAKDIARREPPPIQVTLWRPFFSVPQLLGRCIAILGDPASTPLGRRHQYQQGTGTPPHTEKLWIGERIGVSRPGGAGSAEQKLTTNRAAMHATQSRWVRGVRRAMSMVGFHGTLVTRALLLDVLVAQHTPQRGRDLLVPSPSAAPFRSPHWHRARMADRASLGSRPASQSGWRMAPA